MSSIRLSGTSSGYYDLTVPAAAGTNSIDLSNLPVKDSSNNLNITGKLGVGNTTPHGTYLLKVGPVNTTETIAVQSAGGGAETIMQSYAGTDSRIGSSANTPLNLITNNVSRMTISTAGHVTTPNVPAFHCASSGSSLSSGAFILGSTDKSQSISAVINNGNHYNTGNGRFTAPVAGFYFFSAMASPSQGANSGIYIEKNGSQVSGAAYVYGTSYNGSSVSAVVQLAVGDYAVGVHVPFNSTSESQYSGSFTGFLIG
jgi:hypothetical protein